MLARWVFSFALVVYLLGPARAGMSGSGRLSSLLTQPVAAAAEAVYPRVPESDRSLWSGRIVGALETAGAVALTAATLSRLASAEGTLILAGVTGMASPLWSGSSRSDTPEAFATLVVAAMLWLGIRYPRAFRALLVGMVGTVIATSASGPFESFDPVVFAAYVVSPGRGLLFYAPVAVLALVALVTGRGASRVGRGGAFVVLGVLFEVSWRRDPWGPLGFGPAVLAPCVPVLAVMASGLTKRWLRVGALLCAPAAVAHAAAVFEGGHTWDERRMIIRQPAAIWDLADSPFTDLFLGPPRPDPGRFAAVDFFMRPGDHVTRDGRPLPWLVFGWEKAEDKGVWASGPESWIVVAVPPGDYALTLVASAPGRRGQLQRLTVERPVGDPLEVAFSRQLWELEPVTIPFHAESNVTLLKLRPAYTWLPGHGDVRRCSFFVAALRLRQAGTP